MHALTTALARARFPTGTLSVYRHSAGFGMRMDGIGYSGMTITPYYDSLLVKYTARGSTFGETLLRMRRALQEARIRGVKTNIPFLLNCLTHPQFESGKVRRRLRWRLRWRLRRRLWRRLWLSAAACL